MRHPFCMLHTLYVIHFWKQNKISVFGFSRIHPGLRYIWCVCVFMPSRGRFIVYSNALSHSLRYDMHSRSAPYLHTDQLLTMARLNVRALRVVSRSYSMRIIVNAHPRRFISVIGLLEITTFQ